MIKLVSKILVMTMQLTDNQQALNKEEFITEYPKISQVLLDRTLDNLSQEDSIFIFPNDLKNSPDLDKDQKILETVNQKIKTGNVIGFLGCGQERLTISSRFSSKSDDYFLHYLLQKVLNINLTSLDVGLSREERLYQLLIYLFPKYLEAAMRKGLYKEYQRFSHNDSHIKGVIDVVNHLKKNLPFTGNIAYTTREFTYDNPMMQLIRHTIEYIKNQKSLGRGIIYTNRENITEIIRVTPSYKQADRAKIIRLNQTKPLRHAYFREYRKLQELCLMILNREKNGLGYQEQKIHGILFDVAWLWEEYVYTLLPKGFVHPRNKDKTDGISVFSVGKRKVYPDFYDRERKIVLDAKYKKLEFTEKGINRKDLFQLISYSYILEAGKTWKAGLIFPSIEQSVNSEIGEVAGYGVLLKKLSIQIPQKVSSYSEFCKIMENSEENFKTNIEEKVARK